ncbi:MAG TPA: hypothetical protein VE987_02205 [Polyangiaceae bacterium]|nr:hypothetical protein [Polyangiaceae bacterium]
MGVERWTPAAAALLAVAPACSSSPAVAGDAGVEAGAAPVSFQNDLLPTFEGSCGLSSSCHQDAVTDPTAQRVFLGCKATNPNCLVANPAPVVFQGLMKTSQEDPAMPYVTPGDPTKSYILYKLQGTLSGLESQCLPVSSDPIVQNAPGEPQPAQPCGAPMPLGGSMLTDLADRVRAWIELGAPQN